MPGYFSTWLLTKILNFNIWESRRFYSNKAFYRELIARIDKWVLKYAERFKTPMLDDLQRRRLIDIVSHACSNVTFYRALLNKIPSRRVVKYPDDFESLPIVSKNDLRPHFFSKECVSTDIPAYRRVYNFTSGTTGEPFYFFQDRQITIRRTVINQRVAEWASCGKDYQLIRALPTRSRSIKEVRRNYIEFPCYLLADLENKSEELTRILRQKPSILEMYGSFLLSWAQIVARDKIEIPLIAVITTSEKISEEERRYIEKQLNCPVFDAYGSSELGRVAQECQFKNGFHINSEWCFVEILDKNNKPLPDGEQGRIVITSFDNRIMPFVRYDTGDLGKILPGNCPCGRNLPRLSFEGRPMQIIRLPNNNAISYFDIMEVMHAHIAHIRQFQFIQLPDNSFIILIVPFDKLMESEIEQQIFIKNFESRLGINHCKLQLVDSIPNSKSKRVIFVKK